MTVLELSFQDPAGRIMLKQRGERATISKKAPTPLVRNPPDFIPQVSLPYSHILAYPNFSTSVNHLIPSTSDTKCVLILSRDVGV